MREPLRLSEPCDSIPEIEVLREVMAFRDVCDVEVFRKAVPPESIWDSYCMSF